MSSSIVVGCLFVILFLFSIYFLNLAKDETKKKWCLIGLIETKTNMNDMWIKHRIDNTHKTNTNTRHTNKTKMMIIVKGWCMITGILLLYQLMICMWSAINSVKERKRKRIKLDIFSQLWIKRVTKIITLSQ